MKKLLIFLLFIMIFVLCSCGTNEIKGNIDDDIIPETEESSPEAVMETVTETIPETVTDADSGHEGYQIDNLWTTLSGVWRWIDEDGAPSSDYFIYFGYSDEEKPFFCSVWGYESDEKRYATGAVDAGDFNYTVTYYVPENTEDGLHEIHDAFYESHRYDLSDRSNGRITVTFENGAVSVWAYAGETFDDVYNGQ